MIEYIIIGTLAYALLKSRKGVSGIGSPRRVFGGNSGYVNYSKSKRAVQAESEGKRSISNFDREFVDNVNALLAIVDAEPITITKAKDIARHCKPDEWHHTSMYGNQTNYYSPETVAKAAMNESQQQEYEEYEDQQWEEEKRKWEEESAKIKKQLEEEDKRIKQAYEHTKLLEKAVSQILDGRDEVAKYYTYVQMPNGTIKQFLHGYWINLENSSMLIGLDGGTMNRRYNDGANKSIERQIQKQYQQDLLAEANRMIDEQLNNE